MQVLRTVYTVTNHLGKECKGGLLQRRRGLLRTENIEKPLTQLVFCRVPPAEEDFQTSKRDALYFLKKWCGPTAPISTEHVTDCRLQLQRDPDHTTVTEMGSISGIWTMLLNGIGQNKKPLSCCTWLIHHLPVFCMVLALVFEGIFPLSTWTQHLLVTWHKYSWSLSGPQSTRTKFDKPKSKGDLKNGFWKMNTNGFLLILMDRLEVLNKWAFKIFSFGEKKKSWNLIQELGKEINWICKISNNTIKADNIDRKVRTYPRHPWNNCL